MVFEKIKLILSEQFDIEEENITMETSFREDLDADSLDLIELVMALENEFDAEVLDEDIEHILTVEDAVHYIDKII